VFSKEIRRNSILGEGAGVAGGGVAECGAEERAVEGQKVGNHLAIGTVRSGRRRPRLEQFLEAARDLFPGCRVSGFAPKRDKRIFGNRRLEGFLGAFAEEMPHVFVAVAVRVWVARENVGRQLLRQIPLMRSVIEHQFNRRKIACMVAVARGDHDRDDVAGLHANIPVRSEITDTVRLGGARS
jgi:hypothetical protein